MIKNSIDVYNYDKIIRKKKRKYAAVPGKDPLIIRPLI